MTARDYKAAMPVTQPRHDDGDSPAGNLDSTKHVMKEQPLTILDMKEDETAFISAITGGRHMKARLDGLGIRAGKRIRLISTAPFKGPLLVEDTSTGARVMIGRGMAASVEVRHQGPS